MKELSVIIPARNEMFLKNTVEDVLLNSNEITEIIVIMDGAWADPAIVQHKRVKVIYNPKPKGQRAAVNQGVAISKAKYIMKLDAHCALDKNFDIKLTENIEENWTVVPRMYNLHVFDWVCDVCKKRTYQGPIPTVCGDCQNKTFTRDIVWKPKPSPETDYMCYDRHLHFQYWSGAKKRESAKNTIDDLMCGLGACFFMEKKRYIEIGGLDEKHGSWGQMGVEIAHKSWLSGGRQVINKNTWFAHMFRTQDGFSFPYPNSGTEQAREYSRSLWIDGKWKPAKYTFNYITEKFKPPQWEDVTKGIVYYTDNTLDEYIMTTCQKQLKEAAGDIPIVSVSLKPINFEKNIVLNFERGYLTMAKQILEGLCAIDTEVVFFAEHDVLYHKSHFAFCPPDIERYFYNTNVWKMRYKDGHFLYYVCQQLSGLCANRNLLIKHYEKRVEKIERYGFTRKMGFEPGTHSRPERIDDIKATSWRSQYPNIDIRHNTNLTPNRWKKDQFRNQKYTEGWTESDSVDGWGILIEELKNHGRLSL